MESGKSSSSWPWRKKSTQTHTHFAATASQKQRTGTGTGTGTGRETESATPSGNPNYERRSQSLSETLLTENKSLLQQHAEEGVSERQKAEYKKQVEEAVEQKGDAEDRLRRCMKEREEEESARRKEWDKVRMAMEAKMGEAEEQLVAAEAENSVILTSLQQRDATLALLTQGKDRAEAQLHSLYAKMTTLLKENSRLKYELHLVNKEQQIRRSDGGSPFHPQEHICPPQKQGVEEVHSSKEKVFETLESELQVLRSVGCDVEASPGDVDDVSCAQSLASAMIAELDHFRRDKASIESVASSSHPNKTDDRTSLKQEIEIQAADMTNWRSKYARDTSDSAVIASKFCTSIGEIVKLVKALAHPLLYSTTNSNKSFSDNKFIHIHTGSELSESDLQLNIEKLEAMKEKAGELGGASVSWAAVDFLQVLVGVLNRLVKITLYRNAQRDGCSDDCDDQDDDLTGFASVSQKINTASFNNFLSPLPNIPSKMDFNRETIRHDKLPTKIEESENEEVKSWEKQKQGVVGGHGHPSLNSKHLITPTNSNSSSSSSKLFHFNSNYIKTAIRSTISKTRTQSSVTAPSYPHVKSKPPNKLLNRLLSFS